MEGGPPKVPGLKLKKKRAPKFAPDEAATAVQARYRGRLSRQNSINFSRVIKDWLSALPTSLVVWDFDQTVLRIHAFARGVRAEQVPARWEKDIADKEFFIAFVQAARERVDFL